MTGTLSLLHLQWRTARLWLLLPSALLSALVVAISAGVRELYPRAVERAQYAATIGASPASWAFNGRPYDLDSIGGIAAYEIGFMGQLAFAATGLLLGIRLTRHFEDSGQLELITSAPVARTALPLAAFLGLTGAWTLFMGLSTVGLMALDLPWAGSWSYCTSMGLFGLMISSLGLLLGQVARSSRGAVSLGLGAVLLTYTLRAVIDGMDWEMVGLSPMGWLPEVRPWGELRWWPVLALKGMIVLLAGGALGICARRDLGAGILPERRGRAGAGMMLASPRGLAWRLGHGAVLGWWAGAVIWAGALGVMAEEFSQAVRANPALLQTLGGSAEALVTSLAVVVSSGLAAAAGLSVVLRLGSEELDGRLGLLLAGRLPRWQWWSGWLLVGLGATLVVQVSAGLSLGVAHWLVLEDRDALGEALRASGEAVAAPLLLVSLGALVAAVAPRWRAAAWLPVVWMVVVGMLAEALRLPDWSRRLSALELIGNVPVEPADPGSVALILAVSAGFILTGRLVFARRDLARG